MSDAPERIWAFYAPDIAENENGATIVAHESVQHGGAPYIRADIHAARIAELERQLAEAKRDAECTKDNADYFHKLAQGARDRERDQALEDAAKFIQSANAPIFDYSDGPKALADTMKAARMFAAAIRTMIGTKT